MYACLMIVSQLNMARLADFFGPTTFKADRHSITATRATRTKSYDNRLRYALPAGYLFEKVGLKNNHTIFMDIV